VIFRAPFPLHNSLYTSILPVCLFSGNPGGEHSSGLAQWFWASRAVVARQRRHPPEVDRTPLLAGGVLFQMRGGGSVG
jgi:hypothetical protein